MVKKLNVTKEEEIRKLLKKESEKEKKEIKNDVEQVLEFTCKKCGKEYEYKVGKVSINKKTEESRFEKEPVCPKCKAEKAWELSFSSQIVVNNIFFEVMTGMKVK